MDQNLENVQSTDGPSAEAAESASKVSLIYFASVRETIGVSEETVHLPSSVATVGELIDWLRGRGVSYEAALSDALGVRSAVDRVHATPDTSVKGAREIAIFPMMTGG